MAAINYYLVSDCVFNPCLGQVSKMVYFERNKYQTWFMWFILREMKLQRWFIWFTLRFKKLLRQFYHMQY